MGADRAVVVQFYSRVQNAAVPALRIILYNDIVKDHATGPDVSVGANVS